MTQDERWNSHYQEVMEFVETNHRNPSKYRLEEHNMLNWVKQQRKLHNAGKLDLPGDRYLAAIGARLLLPGTVPMADFFA